MTGKQTDSLVDALEKIFHEPNRLSIMSALCAADKGLTFTELKKECGLTDGNLNRHLKVLQDAGAVTVRKKFVDDKPRTTVCISRQGFQRFSEYLEALSNVLSAARKALPREKEAASIPLGKAAKA